MAWSTLTFGKHKGKSLPQVLFTDPDWFFWAYNEGVFENRGFALKQEADRIYQKATRIRIPQPGGERRLVEYGLYPGTGKFCGLEIVEESRPPHAGSTGTMRSNHIDMSFPSTLASYDKLGCSILVRSLKHLFFGNESARMTQKRCEEFFDDDSHFHEPVS